MKKIIILTLVLALCVPTFFSCTSPDGDSNIQASIPEVNNEQLTPIQAVAKMYKVSQPTKVVAETEHYLNDLLTLTGKYEIVTGVVDSSSASVFVSVIDEIRSVEEGGQNEEIYGIIKPVTKKIEAIEGKGTRVDGGEWDPEGEVWIIGRGRMAINLKDDLVKNVNYDNHVLTFTVLNENVTAVFGDIIASDVEGDVSVKITDDGAVVTAIEIKYDVKANPEAHVDTVTQMTINVHYTYDIERITIE